MSSEKLKASDNSAPEKKALSLKDFLMQVPPLTSVSLDRSAVLRDKYHTLNLAQEKIKLECPSKECNNEIRNFEQTQSVDLYGLDAGESVHLHYICANCKNSRKTYSLQIEYSEIKITAIKIGEIPAFGQRLPPVLLKILGEDQGLFLKGMRCESQGLGVGAFSYYRRVVEHQKNRIFDQIIKVAELLDPDDTLIAELEAAKAETQFKKSMDEIKSALPQALLINGQNPLQLLHTVLSEGLHNETDSVCLEDAQSIRVVLTTLSKNLKQTLNDDKEVTDAVKRLVARRNRKTK